MWLIFYGSAFAPIQPQNIAGLWNFQQWLFEKCIWRKRCSWLKGKSCLFEDSSIRIGWYLNNWKGNTKNKNFLNRRGGVCVFFFWKWNKLVLHVFKGGCLCRGYYLEPMWHCDMCLFPLMSPNCILTFNVHVCIWAFALLESNMQTHEEFLAQTICLCHIAI